MGVLRRLGQNAVIVLPPERFAEDSAVMCKTHNL